MPASLRAPQPSSYLPEEFEAWFLGQGWQPRDFQREVLARTQSGQSTLLIAPTGGGKTLGGFLPALVDLAQAKADSGAPENGHARRKACNGVHTLYISPLKALASDIARNLARPIEEMALSITTALRTGDTPAKERARLIASPPDILLTTPEQLALMVADEAAGVYFATLRFVVLDELHALAPTKRGDLLALGLARLRHFAPRARMIGLSATVADPEALAAFLVAQTPQSNPALAKAALVIASERTQPQIAILAQTGRLPWSGHSARHAMGDVYLAIKASRLALVFVNTRAQAEFVFQALWQENVDNLPIGLHHGSLALEQRLKIEAAMGSGLLRAVVCTSTLDLGLDWGAVDRVIHVGAPKGASRIAQRIGRANHRLEEASNALLVPANRFEMLECRAVREAILAGEQDAETARVGALDVLAQHMLGVACHGPFKADALYDEIRTALPYSTLSRRDFEDTLAFLANGGYALRAYDQFTRLRLTQDGLWRLSHPRMKLHYRLNIGAIVEQPVVKLRLVAARPLKTAAAGKKPLQATGRLLGEVESYFLETLAPGDSFLFAGEVLRFEAMHNNDALVTRSFAKEPKVPSYVGGRLPLSASLAQRVRAMLAAPEPPEDLPDDVRAWLNLQRALSVLPAPETLLIETFPRGAKFYLVAYPFEGRLAHQTLGMLLTRRLERMGAKPLGFVANDYALAIWCVEDCAFVPMDLLFAEDMLGDDLEEWLQESSMMKRSFRTCAIIAGLIERQLPGLRKSGKQLTISSDLIYDVLMRHESDHILLRAARQEASSNLLDLRRLGAMLARVKGHLAHKRLTKISPLAVPIMLEVGRETIYGAGREESLLMAGMDAAKPMVRGNDKNQQLHADLTAGAALLAEAQGN